MVKGDQEHWGRLKGTKVKGDQADWGRLKGTKVRGTKQTGEG